MMTYPAQLSANSPTITASMPGRANMLMSSTGNQGEPVVLGEVSEVLHVPRGQRQSVDQATGGYPGVVLWSGAASQFGSAGQPTPHFSNRLVTGEDGQASESLGQGCSPPGSPLPHHAPLGQFTVGDEGDACRSPRQSCEQGRR